MATNGHSGHSLKWFKDQNAVRQHHECAICLEVLKDPVQMRDCGHQFCALCIEDVLRIDPRCPSCRIEISDANMIFEDQAARRLINQLDVNCCNEGCSWQGCLSSLLQDHQNSCKFLIRSADNVHQIDVGKLEQTLETLMLKVSTLEKKHEEDIEQLNLKFYSLQHCQDMEQLRQQFLMAQTMGAAHAPQRVQQPLANFSNHQERVPTHIHMIRNFARQLTQAILGDELGRFESEPFSSSHGYKMKFQVSLNQTPIGFDDCMGIYLVLMKSDQDAFLAWPFTKRFTFILVDQQDDPNQRQNIEETILPNGEKNFERPLHHQNVGRGWQNFVKHSILRTRQYVRDDTVRIEVVIDP